jgi:hypothetical protein
MRLGGHVDGELDIRLSRRTCDAERRGRRGRRSPAAHQRLGRLGELEPGPEKRLARCSRQRA